jgi:dynein heavy chain 2
VSVLGIKNMKLLRDLLSNQQHYDWGLRSMKSVLKSAGNAMQTSGGGEDEESLVVHSLMLSTLSKLTFADFRHFNSLLDDVFPGKIRLFMFNGSFRCSQTN